MRWRLLDLNRRASAMGISTMRGIARLLSAGIAMLLATGALAQPPAQPHDTTPCRKIALERLSVPDDFSLSFRSGPTHAAWGTTTITTVYASGAPPSRRCNARKNEPARAKKRQQNGSFLSSDPARLCQCRGVRLLRARRVLLEQEGHGRFDIEPGSHRRRQKASGGCASLFGRAISDDRFGAQRGV